MATGPTPDSALARTVLAWNRSELAAIVCVAALIRHLWPLHGAVEDLTLGGLGLAAGIWAIAAFLSRRLEPRDRQLHLGEDVFRLMTASALLFAVAALALAFLASP